MLVKRAVSAIVMLVAGFALAIAGGWVFTLGVSLILAITSWEFGRMFQSGGYHPSFLILIIGIPLLTIAAKFDDPYLFFLVFSLAVLLGTTYHILKFSSHPKDSGIGLAATLAGLVFIGFLGSYIVKLRFRPDGLFWLILSLVPASISDIGAFFAGSLFGSHKLAPGLSPNKTIEGYLGGLLAAAISGYISGAVAGIFKPLFTGLTGLAMGISVGALCPLGDLGKSLFKRQFNLKHTSNLIPGHGGVLDRMDTLIWASVIGYYLVSLIF